MLQRHGSTSHFISGGETKFTAPAVVLFPSLLPANHCNLLQAFSPCLSFAPAPSRVIRSSKASSPKATFHPSYFLSALSGHCTGRGSCLCCPFAAILYQQALLTGVSKQVKNTEKYSGTVSSHPYHTLFFLLLFLKGFDFLFCLFVSIFWVNNFGTKKQY